MHAAVQQDYIDWYNCDDHGDVDNDQHYFL